MLCAQTDANGVVSIPAIQPPDISNCSLVISTATDMANNPFSLSVADGSAIAGAIVIVWGVGFAGRALIRSLSLGVSNHAEE